MVTYGSKKICLIDETPFIYMVYLRYIKNPSFSKKKPSIFLIKFINVELKFIQEYPLARHDGK